MSNRKPGAKKNRTRRADGARSDAESLRASVAASASRAAAAIAHALKIFRRIHELRGFGVGGIAASISPDDEFVVVARDAVVEAIEDLAPRLHEVCGTDGIPLDVLSSMVEHVGDPPEKEIGIRGGGLCSLLLHFVGSLGASHTAGCVKALEGLEGEIRSLAADLVDALEDPGGQPRAHLQPQSARFDSNATTVGAQPEDESTLTATEPPRP